MKRLLAIGMLMLCVGCGPAIVLNPVDAPRLQTGSAPELNKTSFATVGDPIYSEYSYYGGHGTQLMQPVTRTVGFNSIEAPAGARLISAIVGSKASWCTAQPAFFALAERRSVCFYDEGNTGAFTKVWVAGYPESTGVFEIPPVRYSTAEYIGPGGYKYELLYQGIDHGVVRLSYREFVDNLARPAFQQDVTYTLDGTGATMVSFKGVRMQIDHADNNGLDYRVLSAFSKR